MKLKTDFVVSPIDVLLIKVERAVTQRIKMTNQIKNSIHHLYRSIRAKIFRSVINTITGWQNSWERLLSDTNPWVGFIVFEQDVIPGLVFLNKVIFKQQSIQFAIYNKVT